MPLLMSEMQPSWRQQYDHQSRKASLPPGGPINVGGALVGKSIDLFAVKLCLAFHYYHLGTIVPKGGGIVVRFFTNYEGWDGAVPEELQALFTSTYTLKQGNWNVDEQFGYSWAVSDDLQMSAYMAAFRQSFVISGFIPRNWIALPEIRRMKIYAPGFTLRRDQ
jgi:hypothetical protein